MLSWNQIIMACLITHQQQCQSMEEEDAGLFHWEWKQHMGGNFVGTFVLHLEK